MSKKDRHDRSPFYVDMDVDISNIERLPPDMTPAKLFEQCVKGAVVRVSTARKGISMDDQRKFNSLRKVLEGAISSGKTQFVPIPFDEFKFLQRYWNDQTAEANINELLMRVDERIRDAKLRHDRGEEPQSEPEKEETVKEAVPAETQPSEVPETLAVSVGENVKSKEMFK